MTDSNRPADDDIVEEAVIPIVEEEVDVARRKIVGRTITVTTSPVTREETISEPVTRATVSVERVPIGKVVDEVPQVREQGDLTIVPVVEERVRIVRELVLAEEIHLRRTVEEGVVERSVELRRTQVRIDESDG